MGHAKTAFKAAAVVVLIPVALHFVPDPENTHIEDGQRAPDAGYRWVYPKYSGPFIVDLAKFIKEKAIGNEVAWGPDSKHPMQAHIHAASKEKQWNPDIGYEFVSENGLKVAWKQGLRYAGLPHITSSKQEGKWDTDPGYVLSSDNLYGENNSLKAVWTQELPHPDFPNIVAHWNEGQWVPAEGYGWKNGPKLSNSAVVWVPGSSGRFHPHIVASETEGKWSPDPGYRFTDPPKSLNVVWAPNQVLAPHVLSGAKEGSVVAEKGYHFERDKNGRLVVVEGQANSYSCGEGARDGVLGAVLVTGAICLADLLLGGGGESCAEALSRTPVSMLESVAEGCIEGLVFGH